MSTTATDSVPSRTGAWPDGEPRPVRVAADRSVRAFDVYMVVIGGYDTYEVVAIYEDRHMAGEVARTYNEAHSCLSDITRCARVEEISFHRSEMPS